MVFVGIESKEEEGDVVGGHTPNSPKQTDSLQVQKKYRQRVKYNRIYRRCVMRTVFVAFLPYCLEDDDTLEVEL